MEIDTNYTPTFEFREGDVWARGFPLRLTDSRIVIFDIKDTEIWFYRSGVGAQAVPAKRLRALLIAESYTGIGRFSLEDPK